MKFGIILWETEILFAPKIESTYYEVPHLVQLRNKICIYQLEKFAFSVNIYFSKTIEL